MIITIILLTVISGVLGYLVYNLTKKVQIYETTIEEFYSALSIALHNMRAIDERQLFESDDEVGSVFEQLSDIINELRPLLYGTTDDQNRRRNKEE
jgi:hypothetical protein